MPSDLLRPTTHPPCVACGRETCEGTHAIDDEQLHVRVLIDSLRYGAIVGRALPIDRAADAAAASAITRRNRDAATFKLPRRL